MDTNAWLTLSYTHAKSSPWATTHSQPHLPLASASLHSHPNQATFFKQAVCFYTSLLYFCTFPLSGVIIFFCSDLQQQLASPLLQHGTHRTVSPCALISLLPCTGNPPPTPGPCLSSPLGPKISVCHTPSAQSVAE